MVGDPKLPEARLEGIYTGTGFGGDSTMRAKVIRELVDEIRALRVELTERLTADATDDEWRE